MTFEKYKDDPEFLAEFRHYLKDYSGRETPLYYAESLTEHLGGARIYLKREDLNHLGSHKLNNVLGQILLAKRMGKKRVIAETGAGQHGVATAAAAAKFGMACDVYMGAEDGGASTSQCLPHGDDGSNCSRSLKLVLVP